MAGWIHHIDITVSDLPRSTDFYDRVLPRMGFHRLSDVPEGPIWAGERMEIGLVAARTVSERPHDRYAPGMHHLAFGAPNREAVGRLHQDLQGLGAQVLDAPAPYDQYGPGYYAVFFADPDGIKLEYVYTPAWPSAR